MEEMKQSYELELRVEGNQLISNAIQFAESVRASLKKYCYVVDISNYDQAKKDRATLNKVIENISRKRIETEKEFLTVWQPTKEVLTSLEKELKAVANDLGNGVNTFDEKAKEAKKDEIISFYQTMEVNGLDFEKIFNEKWLNKSTSTKQWQEELTAKVEKVNADINYITQFKLEDEHVFLSSYLGVLDIPAAKAKYDAYIISKRKAEEIKKQKEQEEQKAVVQPKLDLQPTNWEKKPTVQEKTEEDITTVVVMKGTKSDLDSLLNVIETQFPNIKVHPYNKEEDM